MLKIYKHVENKIYYWQAWQHGTDVFLHWGEVGQRGEHKTIPLGAENAEDVLLRESTPIVNQGFSEIEPLSLLAIEFKCEGEGSPADLKKSSEIEYLTNQFLGWTGNGFCDGNEIVNGTLTVFCCVMDRQIAADMTITCLRAAQLLDGVKIESIANVEDDDEIPFVHYPEKTVETGAQAQPAAAIAPNQAPSPQSEAPAVVADLTVSVSNTAPSEQLSESASEIAEPNAVISEQTENTEASIPGNAPVGNESAGSAQDADEEGEDDEEEEPEEPVDTRVRIDRTTYKINQTVIHDTFGKGKITNITDVNCLAVKFETAGRRLLDARHAILYAPEKKKR